MPALSSPVSPAHALLATPASWAGVDIARAVAGDGGTVGGEGYDAAAGGYQMHAEAGVEVDIIAGAQAEGFGRAHPGRENEDAVGRVVVDGVAVERGVEVDDGAARRGGDGVDAGIVEREVVVGDAQRDEIDRAGADRAVVEAEAGAA